MSLCPKKTKSMVVSRSRTFAPDYDDLTLGGAELELQSAYSWGNIRLLNSRLRLICGKLCQKQPGVWWLCTEPKCYLYVHE